MANELQLGSVQFAELAQGAHRIANRYWRHVPNPPGPNYETQFNSAPGTDGRRPINHGFRSRLHGPFVCLYVAASVSALEGMITTDINAIGTGGVTVQYPGGTSSENCRRMNGYPHQVGNRRISEGGSTVYASYVWMMEQDY